MVEESNVEVARQMQDGVDVIIEMLRREPSDVVLSKTTSGSITMAQMITLLANRDETGSQWIAELLRISRDVVTSRIEEGFAPGAARSDFLPQLSTSKLVVPLAQIAREVRLEHLWKEGREWLAGVEVALALHEGSEVGRAWAQQIFCQCETLIRARKRLKESSANATGKTLEVADVIVEILRRSPKNIVGTSMNHGDSSAEEMSFRLAEREKYSVMWMENLLLGAVYDVARRVAGEEVTQLTPSEYIREIVPDVNLVNPLTELIELANRERTKYLWHDGTELLTGYELVKAVEANASVAREWLMQLFCECDSDISAKWRRKKK